MLKIRQSCNCRILNMGIPIPGKDYLHIESAPWFSSQPFKGPALEVLIPWDNSAVLYRAILLFQQSHWDWLGNLVYIKSPTMGFSVPHTKGLQIACLHIIQSRKLLVEDKGNTISSGAQFTNNFSITFQIQWKFHFGVAVVLFLFIVPQQTYVHTMTMQLPCHVQKFTVICLLEFGWEQNKIFKEF